jgi:hypothetical protein
MLFAMYKYPVLFFRYNIVTIFKITCILSFCILKTFKISVTIFSCSTLISVVLCYLLCVFAIYVFIVSSCVWVCIGVETLRGPCCCCRRRLHGVVSVVLLSLWRFCCVVMLLFPCLCCVVLLFCCFSCDVVVVLLCWYIILLFFGLCCVVL